MSGYYVLCTPDSAHSFLILWINPDCPAFPCFSVLTWLFCDFEWLQRGKVHFKCGLIEDLTHFSVSFSLLAVFFISCSTSGDYLAVNKALGNLLDYRRNSLMSHYDSVPSSSNLHNLFTAHVECLTYKTIQKVFFLCDLSLFLIVLPQSSTLLRHLTRDERIYDSEVWKFLNSGTCKLLTPCFEELVGIE